MKKILDGSYKETSLIEKYNLKKLYYDNIFSKNYYPYFYDGFNEHKKYGFYDNDDNLIIPNLNYLSTYFNNNQIAHRNLFFTIDAFKDLKKYYQDMVKRSIITSDVIFNNLNVTKSSDDINVIYNKYSSDIYNIFTNTFLVDVPKHYIKNINDFMKYFISFVKIAAKNFPITRTSYLKSKKTSINISGLCFSFNEILNDSVISNVNNIMSYETFDFFVENSARFGFFVDRNFPFRIIADLKSPAMKKYMSYYSIFSDDFVYKNYFFRAENNDLNILKNMVLNYWNLYASENPTVVQYDDLGSCKKTFVSVHNVSGINLDILESYYSNNWFLRLYSFIRILEEKINISQVRFDSIHKEAYNILSLYDEKQAIQYINLRIKELSEQNNVIPNDLTSADDMVKILERYKFNNQFDSLNF